MIYLNFSFKIHSISHFSCTVVSALHRAARDGNEQACHILLSYHVDDSITSLQGYTALQLATENIKTILQGKFFRFFFLIQRFRLLRNFVTSILGFPRIHDFLIMH